MNSFDINGYSDRKKVKLLKIDEIIKQQPGKLYVIKLDVTEVAFITIVNKLSSQEDSEYKILDITLWRYLKKIFNMKLIMNHKIFDSDVKKPMMVKRATKDIVELRYYTTDPEFNVTDKVYSYSLVLITGNIQSTLPIVLNKKQFKEFKKITMAKLIFYEGPLFSEIINIKSKL
jgi:hypothetical protein